MNRPSFAETYISMCYIIAQRSHDSQTKVGAVLTDEDNTICSTGYNGFASGINDIGLPTERPGKYQYMLHAEENMILNCKHKPKNGIVYLNTAPCFKCVQKMWQFGIRKIIYSNLFQANCVDPEDSRNTNDFILRTGNTLSISQYNFDNTLIRHVNDLLMSQLKKGV